MAVTPNVKERVALEFESGCIFLKESQAEATRIVTTVISIDICKTYTITLKSMLSNKQLYTSRTKEAKRQGILHLI